MDNRQVDDSSLPELSAPTWKDRISNVRTSVTNLKPTLTSKAESVRSTMKRSSTRLSDSLRSHTGLWTAAAAAGGLGVGLLGRSAMGRKHDRGMPTVVIIEASC
jgi:hypothetical protein